jgi:hypothetical protein
MYQSKVTIDSLIGEHIAIRGHMEMIRASTREWEQLLGSGERVLQDRAQLQILADKLASLRQAMSYLEDGLRNHHAHEAELMPSLIGNLLWKAISLEHDEMLKMMDEINSLILNPGLEVFLENGTRTMQKIDTLRGFASAHSIKEDGILLFLKKLPNLQ